MTEAVAAAGAATKRYLVVMPNANIKIAISIALATPTLTAFQSAIFQLVFCLIWVIL